MKIQEILNEARPTDTQIAFVSGIKVFIGSHNGSTHHWLQRLLERHPDKVNDKVWQTDYIEALAIAASKHPYVPGTPTDMKVFIILEDTGSVCEWKPTVKQLVLNTIYPANDKSVPYPIWVAKMKWKPPAPPGPGII